MKLRKVKNEKGRLMYYLIETKKGGFRFYKTYTKKVHSRMKRYIEWHVDYFDKDGKQINITPVSNLPGNGYSSLATAKRLYKYDFEKRMNNRVAN